MLVGSAINIWFNVTNIDPLLTPGQRALFVRTVTLYNLVVSRPALALAASRPGR